MARKLGSLAKGLVISFAANGILALLAGISHTVEYSFFFDYVYEFEGSLCATVLITVGILLLIRKMKLV